MSKAIGFVFLVAASCLFAACGSNLSSGEYSIGGTVTGLLGMGLVLQNNSDDDLSISSNGSFIFSKGVARGASYSVIVKLQPSNPTQTCSVSNGPGMVGQSDITDVLISCAQASGLAFVTNKLSSTLSAYTVNSDTGALTPAHGSPFASTGTAPQSVAVGSSGEFLYVANNGSNNISVFSFIEGTGVLSPVGVPISAGSAPYGLAINPTGGFLYVSNFASNTISAYSINSANGLLTEIADSPFGVGSGPAGLKIDSSGKFLYVANHDSGSVSVLQIDSGNGSLSNIVDSPFAAGLGAIAIAIDSTGKFAYVANENAATISEYSINSSTGALTARPGSPIAPGSSPEALASDPAGSYLFAANVTNAGNVAAYSIASSGALSLAGAPVTAGALPMSVAVDPLGRFAYVANNGTNNIAAFAINSSTGELTPAAQFLVSAGNGPSSIVIK